MPTSSIENISYSCDLIRKISPESILDVGCGFGKWGYLSREILDIAYGRYARDDWHVRIDGVEIFPAYLTPVHRHIYNNVIIGDAFEHIQHSGPYDLIIFGDVIEHFRKPDALCLLNHARSKARKGILLHIPLGRQWPQDARGGNVYEEHKSTWTEEELRDAGAYVKTFRDPLGRCFAVALMLDSRVAFHPRLRRMRRWLLSRRCDLTELLLHIEAPGFHQQPKQSSS